MLRNRAVLLATLALCLAHSAHAVAVPGLFDSGVDSAGAALPAGAVDAHYALIASADLTFAGPSAFVATGLASGNWIANTATSQWIAPAVDENWPAMGTALAAGDYVYRLSFNLAGIDPATVSVSGSYGVDNGGVIKLNGAPMGSGISSYSPLVGFALGSGFVTGVNHLDFVVTNWAASGSNPSGLRVQGIHGTGTAIAGVGDPSLPHAFVLFAPSPNPSRNSAHVAFTLPRADHAQLRVLDLGGRVVRTLAEGDFTAGLHESTWDGRDIAGAVAPAGIYFASLEVDGHREARRLVRMP
jgi:hypothetical protein